MHLRVAYDTQAREAIHAKNAPVQWDARVQDLFAAISRRNACVREHYRCNGSVGTFTSVTRKVFASAGCLLAISSYIAQATLR